MFHYILCIAFYFYQLLSSSWILSSSLMISRFTLSFDIKSFIDGNCFSEKSKDFKARTCLFPWYSVVFVCFLKAFPRGEYVNLACSIVCFWLEDNIFSLVRYSYLLILPYDRADIFAASLSI